MKRFVLFASLIIAAVSLVAFGARADDSLYQDLGGHDGIVKIANQTADNFLADDRIKHTFDDTNMDRFRAMLADQFCQLTGGPCVYKGHDMKAAHKGLHLGTADFNAVVEDLQDAMSKCDVPFRTQNRLLALLAPMKRDIVTK
jgi:hemoglobin